MENTTPSNDKKEEQTSIGKISGWFFGLNCCLAIFSVGQEEIGALGLWVTVIGILLLPPVNMRLRKKYQDFVKCHHADKYSTNIINLGYTSMKTTFMILLLIIITSISPSNPETATNTPIKQQTKITQTHKEKPIPMEYKNALIKAESYSETMHMSKRGIYDQLTSEYGEQFQPNAAKYAVDNLNANFQINALEKAKSYQETMSMSTKAIYDQLISESGEKFTAKEAQYAINHLNN